MDWNFSFGWLLAGLGIAIVGALIIVFYQKIADNFASGVSSYGKVKLWGVIITLIGLFVMANLHTLILSLLVKLIFPNQ